MKGICFVGWKRVTWVVGIQALWVTRVLGVGVYTFAEEGETRDYSRKLLGTATGYGHGRS